MTGYTVNTGSSQKFSAGWDNVFTKGSKKTEDKKGKKKGDSIVYVDKSKNGPPPLGKK